MGITHLLRQKRDELDHMLRLSEYIYGIEGHIESDLLSEKGKEAAQKQLAVAKPALERRLLDFALAACAHFPKYETTPVLTLSMLHIEKETNDWLCERGLGYFPHVAIYEFGYFVYVPTGDLPDDLPGDLATVLAFANAKGYRWIRLERDGSEIDDLPTFAWV